MLLEGLAFEKRVDDVAFEPVRDADISQLITEESWRDPELAHIQSSFANHARMIEQVSIERGISNEYSQELLESKVELESLGDWMLSFEEMRERLCACPEDFGMTKGFVEKLFGDGDHENDSLLKIFGGDDGHDHGNDGKGKKKKKKRFSWLYNVERVN